MRKTFYIWCIVLCFVAPASAQEAYTDTSLLKEIDVATLEAALKQMGKPYTMNTAVEPAMLDIKHTILNAQFSLQPVCFSEESGRSGCPGINIISIFPGVSLEKINTFNMNSEAVKAQSIPNDDGQTFTLMSYYVAADSGITFGTLRGVLIRFENAMTRWISEIRSLNIVSPE